MKKYRGYKNLNKGCWSLKLGSSGRVEHHKSMVMSSVSFLVSEASRQAAIRKGQRSVHAWAVGDVMELDIPISLRPTDREVSYNPFKSDHFYYCDTGARVESAAILLFTEDVKVYVRI